MTYLSAPLMHFDVRGLTQCDINVACSLIRDQLVGTPIQGTRDSYPYELPPSDAINTDGFDASPHPATGQPPSGYTHPLNGIFLNPKYLEGLSDRQALDLLDTLVHEGLHWTLPWNDPKQRDGSGSRKTFPYTETKRLLKEFNLKEKYRKERGARCP